MALLEADNRFAAIVWLARPDELGHKAEEYRRGIFEYVLGGDTSEANCQMLSKRHNRVKDNG